MKHLVRWLALFLCAGLVLEGCAQVEKTTPTASPGATAAKSGTVSSETGWERKWETALEQGRKEGVVLIYTVWGAEIRNALTRSFKQKYGIDLEFSTFSRGPEVSAKAEAEARAGLYLADMFGPAIPPLILYLKPQHLLSPIAPLMILPEALDSNAWLGGKLSYVDKEGMALSIIGSVNRSVIYNGDLIKDGEITSFKDLLQPKYKGKMILNDPSIAGGSNAALAHLGETLWGEAETVDFLRKLIKDQEAVIQRDHRLHVEWIARQKYPIGIAPLREAATGFIIAGAPIKYAQLKEDSRLSASSGAIGVAAKPPHPNATAVFLNWLLTKQGQSVFATSFGAPSTRLDASTDGIDPLLIPEPGVKYFTDSEDDQFLRAKWLEIAQKIMAER